jgi:hypothetical protein
LHQSPLGRAPRSVDLPVRQHPRLGGKLELRSSSLRRALCCPTFGSSREDGLIWVYGVGEDGVQAFTDFGIENLIEFVRFYKENPKLLTRGQRE